MIVSDTPICGSRAASSRTAGHLYVHKSVLHYPASCVIGNKFQVVRAAGELGRTVESNNGRGGSDYETHATPLFGDLL
jgi:hypothetical protein